MPTKPVRQWPKWPALLVEGDRVTKDQAAEIIVRTFPRYFITNDRSWEKLVRKKFGLPAVRESSSMPVFEQEEKAFDALGMLRLNYLHNDWIMSAWVGGPHGWVDWNGRVFTANYNIGKGPSPGDVRREWDAIAKAFPFLKLKAQLMSGETCEEGTHVIAEYKVARGKVVRSKVPGKVICGGPADEVEDFARHLAFPSSLRERGCTEEQLDHAIAIVKAKLKGAKK